MDTIQIRLNGKDRDVSTGLTVAEFVRSLELNPAQVVVELNREILSRSQFPVVRVKDGDTVELVHFVGGG